MGDTRSPGSEVQGQKSEAGCPKNPYFLFPASYLLHLTSYFLLAALPLLQSASNLELVYNGNFLKTSEVINLGGQDYISVKSAAHVLQGKTQWYPIAGEVILQVKNQRIQFVLDSKNVLVGNKKITMNAPLRIIKNQAYAPLNFFLSSRFSEIVDYTISLDSQKQTLSVRSKATLPMPRIFARDNLTRILIESRDEIRPELQKKDLQILVEIPKARIAQEEEIELKNSVVEQLKMIPTHKGVLLKIKLSRNVTSYSLTQAGTDGRWVLQFQDMAILQPAQETVGSEHNAELQSLTEIAIATPALPETKVFTPNPLSLKPIRKILVDAGHGGKDSGAKGPKGTKEKEINLLLALELAEVLSREGYEVIMTRSDDTFVPLVERTLFANQNKADLFISIHCNASPKKRRVRTGKQFGFEIYFLSDDASDSHAEAAAEFENEVIELEDHSSGQNAKLQELLFSMERAEFINESSLLCHKIANAVEKRVPIANRGVKQADFHVLHGARMPSVLVEAAFLDFPSDEKKLRTNKFRAAMVESIFSGIQDYEKQLELLYLK